TADCTMLEMKENTDLVQIRPAFGGNIMAQIITPNTRPQFCTVRYKIFSAPGWCEPNGEVINMPVTDKMLSGDTEVLKTVNKPEEIDISDAEIIVAVGRGIKSKDDLALAEKLANKLGAQLACTRPLIEAGWFDAKRQIGLSGRTVKPKLIITLGVSGSVQFAAGMQNSDKIIAVNSDKSAPIFKIAHYGFVGDLYEIVPKLLEKIEEAKNV
ncbi:MAG: electron transfer flavoprotein subunit alpha/FixB family protein, partial [Clostridia bacterium]|nr:electron transfer flavoprotein subunit alpha/FixB family protein [Clostridia bacterium]